MGVGAAGVMTVATILVLEAASQKRRGLFIGCLNSGFTAGVALGAVVAGQLLPLIGWVCCLSLEFIMKSKMLK